MIGLYSANSQSITSAPFSFGNALQFDGTDDFVDFTSTGAMSSWTFSCWINRANLLTNRILASDGQNSSAQLIFLKNSTTISVRTGTDKNYTIPAMSIDTWYHIFISSNAGSCRVYVNGVESSSGAQAIGNLTLARLGARGNDLHIQAIYDELGINLTTSYGLTEAQAAYNSGSGADITAIISPEIAYHFNETSGASTAVNSGSGGATYNGTLNNFNTATCWVAH